MRLTAEGLAASRGERPLFGGLGFALGAGDALILTGPNGSGKSSLLRLVAGFGRPTAGVLRWDGRPLSDDLDAYRQQLHYVGHQEALKPALSAVETLRFWADLAEQPLKDPAGPLRVLGLGHKAHTPCRFLSSGQRRRAALARVIAGGAPIWLLDEPTVGLDVKSIVALEAALAVHRAAGGIVIVATHAPIALPGAGGLNLADFPPARPVAMALDW